MKIERIDENIWIVKKEGRMRVPAIVYTDGKSIRSPELQNALQQLVNVATMPGIIKYAIAMPDIHWGYGFPIGGVAAFDAEEGVISPGGVGFDINCGVRLLVSNLKYEDVEDRLDELANAIFETVPVGVGSRSRKFSIDELKKVCRDGAAWAVEKGYGEEEDLRYIEDGGKLKDADPSSVSHKAYERGSDEIGTLGGGNHFIEIQRVESVYDREVAERLGIHENAITVMIHTGSRGFGHQIATDYISIMRNELRQHNSDLPDKQLINAPFKHPIGQDYFHAMCCAANYAFANRQMITHLLRKAFTKVFGGSVHLKVLYDVAHNVAKLETHELDGTRKRVVVHRKGATRAFGPGNSALPAEYKDIGQPVLIPGDMGTASYLLLGTKRAEKDTFGTTAHGAGRRLGRRQAKRELSLVKVMDELKRKKIIVRSASRGTLLEEAPEAYKDVDEIVWIVDKTGISRKIARMVPIAVIKG
ncbi:MAG: RtcB family protein [Thermotogae bacterium]|nr:RtcB family protein [Thermotogota bacterium]